MIATPSNEAAGQVEFALAIVLMIGFLQQQQLIDIAAFGG